MNLKKVADWLLGGSHRYRRPPITRHHDPDLGDYRYDPSINLWWIARCPSETSEFHVRGRSEHPTSRQKELLEHFQPLLSSLAQQALQSLEVPEGFTIADLPKELTVREVRFEANGDVELFFEPGLEIERYDASPMATCSEDGRLLSVCWTV